MASPNKVSPSDCDNDRQPRNGSVAARTGNIYISRTMTERITIAAANLGYSTTHSANKLTPGDYENERQPGNCNIEVWAPRLQFLVVDRCRNHFVNLLSSSSSSKIPNLALEFRRYLSEFQRCNHFRFWGPYRYYRLSVAVVLTFQHYFPPIRGL